MNPTKAHIRKQVRLARRQLTEAQVIERSARIMQRVLSQPELHAAATVFVYVSMRGEVETHGLIERLLERGVTVAVPLVVGPRQMEAHRIRGLHDLAAGALGILEPRTRALMTGPVDVCIAPGLAFSRQCDRLGSGGGFYDRYLASTPPRLTIGIGFDLQVIDNLPVEAWDQPVDRVITETHLFARQSPSPTAT